MTSRANFTQNTRHQLEINTGGLCANPVCRKLTRGPTHSGTGDARTGHAAHINSASPQGPVRPGPTENVTREQLRAIENGVWLCATCATLVDTNPYAYPVEMLRAWQASAQRRAYHAMNRGPALPTVVNTNDVIARSVAFRKRVQDMRLPMHWLRDIVDIDTLTIDKITMLVQEMGAQQEVYGLTILPGPLHGLEPDLVLLQEHILTLLWQFARLVKDSPELWLNHLSRRFEQKYPGYSPEFAQQGDQLLVAIFTALKTLNGWCTGEPYYRR